jgi:RNA polymerase sigma factor (TIGR02999 family)
MADPTDITANLAAARGGERAALDAVFSRVYEEIRRIASGQLARAGRASLSTTAVVHEAYLKLVRGPAIDFEDRRHFYAVAATAMRHILLNHARAKAALKRDGGQRLSLERAELAVEDHAQELLALDAALERLAALDERLARVVELRFYAGLTVEEAAKILGVTDRTVKRDWRAARAFLHRQLDPGTAA